MDTASSGKPVAMEVDCKITTENTRKTSTLGRSRKKKAAPQPPGMGGGGGGTSASDTEKSTASSSSKNKNSATYKSASSGKKSGVKTLIHAAAIVADFETNKRKMD